MNNLSRGVAGTLIVLSSIGFVVPALHAEPIPVYDSWPKAVQEDNQDYLVDAACTALKNAGRNDDAEKVLALFNDKGFSYFNKFLGDIREKEKNGDLDKDGKPYDFMISDIFGAVVTKYVGKDLPKQFFVYAEAYKPTASNNAKPTTQPVSAVASTPPQK